MPPRRGNNPSSSSASTMATPRSPPSATTAATAAGRRRRSQRMSANNNNNSRTATINNNNPASTGSNNNNINQPASNRNSGNNPPLARSTATGEIVRNETATVGVLLAISITGSGPFRLMPPVTDSIFRVRRLPSSTNNIPVSDNPLRSSTNTPVNSSSTTPSLNRNRSQLIEESMNVDGNKTAGGGLLDSFGGAGAGEDGTPRDCPICFEEYRNPKSLRCGHSVCGPCVESLIQSENWADAKQVRVTCPFCREQTGPFSRSKELPTNYQLMEYIKSLKDVKQRQSCENCGYGRIGAGGIGDREPCFVCSQPTPKSKIWFCTSKECSSQQSAGGMKGKDQSLFFIATGNEGEGGGCSLSDSGSDDNNGGNKGKASGLKPLCPQCCIKLHKGHLLSLLTDEVRQKQMRVYFDDFSTCLCGLEKMENLDWALLTKVLFNLAIVEYSADPVGLKNVHKDIGHLCSQMIGKGWLCKPSAAASKVEKRRVKYGDGAEGSNNNDTNESKSALLSNIARCINTYFTMHRQKKQEENGVSSPQLKKCRKTIGDIDNFVNQIFNDINPIADKLSSARKRSRLCGFTKLIGEMYVVGVPNMDEWVDKCFHSFILVDKYDPSPTADEMEAVLDLINTIGATWMYRESARKGLISTVITQVIMDSIRVPDCSHIKTYAKTIQTRHEEGWRETDERGRTDLNSRMAMFLQKRREMKELDDE